MSDESDNEISSSALGTLEFWDNVYSRDLDNFKDHGDVGEIWFGNKNSQKIIQWISARLDVDKDKDEIIDIGCGNAMILVKLAAKGFQNLVGVDYSQKAIDLAKEVLKTNGIENNIKLDVCDITDTKETLNFVKNFKLAHDKGTYDAISLHPEESKIKRENYVKNVNDLLVPNGYLILTSCNWTRAELEKEFIKHFEIIEQLPVETIQFGGKSGSTVTQLVFQKRT
ncbi:EEF1A lysine methyltransferase 2 [Prorops nasuta]|uniref:EEF1A lysine methyltransferase 2 n=1 Tax=Prorops nasuta TaxID=863751 RepID=UPI0034CDE8E5